MRTTKWFMRQADPMSGQRTGALSQRARDEFQALTGVPLEPANPPRVPLWDPSRVPLRDSLGDLARSGARAGASGPAWLGHRRLALGLVAVVVLIAAGVVGAMVLRDEPAMSPTVDEPFYGTTQVLEARADLIVRATIRSTREQDKNGYPETVANAVVRKVAKGGVVAGQRLEFRYVTPGSGAEAPTGLRAGGEYVLLLERYPDASPSLVSTIQGYYTVSRGRVVPHPDNPVALSLTVLRDLDLR